MKFEDVIDIKHWQNLQDIFSSLVNLPIKTIGKDGEIVVRPSNVAGICSEAIGNSPQARKRCWQWYPQLADFLMKQPASDFYVNVCPLGLSNFAVPIVFNNSEPVYMIIGPLVTQSDAAENSHFTQKIRDFGVEEQKFFECFNKLPAIDKKKIDEIMEALSSITSFMGMLDDFGHKNAHIDIIQDKEKIAKVLKEFLELAMKLCEAERGSVMMFEKNKQELSIKDSKGLSEDVVNNTKLKPGEGLAGMSISRRKALFVDEQLKDREVRLRMQQPKIKSAFVIPVFYKTEILGVISVGTTRKPNRFSDKLMELLNELVGMTLEKIALE